MLYADRETLRTTNAIVRFMIMSSSSLPLILSLENMCVGGGGRRTHVDLPLDSEGKKSSCHQMNGVNMQTDISIHVVASFRNKDSINYLKK